MVMVVSHVSRDEGIDHGVHLTTLPVLTRVLPIHYGAFPSLTSTPGEVRPPSVVSDFGSLRIVSGPGLSQPRQARKR